MTLARFNAVGKEFEDETVALEGFDLTLRRSEFLSLIGPSGCGKSTALRLLAGLMEPTDGGIAWPDGRPGKSGLGIVFQDATLMPWATVADNVALPLRIARSSRHERDRAVGEMLELVGLEDFAPSHPRALSGGMKMRVAIARALVTRPALLLLDEPFAALDEITRFRLNDELLALKAELDCTILFVTHSVFESVYLSDRIAVMTPRPGRVSAEHRIEAAARGPAFRTSADYAALCRKVSASLNGAIAGENAK